MQLNPSDREQGLALMGMSNEREHARRKGGAAWVGVRASAGVAKSGRWAFCVWNESGGNLRVGWSCADGTLKLGTDQWSWGYGGTATKSHCGKFEKYGQTYGKGDAVTCLLDLDRRAIMYMKNGREIPGDAFQLGKQVQGWALFPHIYTKESTFSVSFDGEGGAPPLQGGFKWIAEAGRAMVPSPKKLPAGWQGADPGEGSSCSSSGGTKSDFVLTAYGWRSGKEAGKEAHGTQEWRTALDAYVRHFTLLLEAEYEAERQDVVERVKRRSIAQLQADGVGMGGLSASIDQESGRITLWSNSGYMPYVQEISRGRTVLLSTHEQGLDIDDAEKTISGEVESIFDGEIILHTQYERLPGPKTPRVLVQYRIDLGPNIIAYKRIDRMLDELQRCLGTAQAKAPRDSIQKLNFNSNLTGLLLPGAPLANALYADIAESSAAATKWDPQSRPRANPQADISKASREKDVGAPPYAHKGPVPTTITPKPNDSQRAAAMLVLEKRRRFSLIQGPPGTGKTTTAVAIICGWLRARRGPILASAFSNRGTDNVAEALHKLGVRVLRMGLCSQDLPYSLETLLAQCGEKRSDKGLRKVMETVDVVCATCIGCGMGPLDKLKFPYVIIDEAAQVIEPAVTLPLGKGAVQAVMVGDQCQLPATVLSQEAQRGGLDISMFDRLLSMGMEVQLLAQQYRMHPQIAAFPSWRFYRGELKSAVAESARTLPPRLPLRAPLAFLHVDATEQSSGSSKKNSKESACVAWLVETVAQSLPRLKGGDIGILTPYSAQVGEIRRTLPAHARESVQVASVDAFQGCEKDYIIFSLVRANLRADVGFVADWRRINVALTRARRLCILVGHLPTWLDAENALIRDWLGYHSLSSAGLYSFQAGQLNALPDWLDRRVQTLRTEFATENHEAAKLPRVSVAARNSTADSKSKLWTLEKAVIDALQDKDEAALQKALTRASEAGVVNSTIEEAESALGRLSAEKELKNAMKTDDELFLRVALDSAKEFQVEDSLIKEGDQSLNRLLAAKSLTEALGVESEPLIELALPQAGEVGVDHMLIAKAQKMLKRLAAARELDALTTADGSGVDYDANLHKAIQNAQSAGVSPGAIRDAEDRWKNYRALSASHDLLVTAAGNDRSALEKALKKAKDVGVPLEDIVNGEARLLLLTAHDTLESAATPAALHLALAATRETGVSAELVEQSENRLRKLAEDSLIEATRGDKIGDLHAALAIARDAGVDEGAIAQAASAHARLISENALVEAIETGSEAALRAALEAAREHEVDVVFLTAGEGKLQKIEATRELRDALELVAALELAGAITTDDTADLKKAVAGARKVGTDKEVIAEAQSVLNRIAKPVVAMETAADALEEAVRTQDSVALGVAIAAAQAHNVDPALIAEAEQLLATLLLTDGSFGDPVDMEVSEHNLNVEQVSAVASGQAGCSRSSSSSPPKRRKICATSETDTMREWSMCLLEIALLACRKQKAVGAENFDLAHSLKLQEVAAGARLQTAQDTFWAATAPSDERKGNGEVAAEIEQLEKQKRQAVEDEDFHRAAQIKERQAALLASCGGNASCASRATELSSELENVRAEKKQAVDAEEFSRASGLRKRELELERQLHELKAQTGSKVIGKPDETAAHEKATSLAVSLLEEETERVQALLQTQGCANIDAGFRAAVVAELRRSRR